MQEGTPSWRNAARSRALTGGLIACALAGGVLLLFAFRASELRGDEVTYATNARILANALTGRGGDGASALAQIIGTGWFMPGMAIIGSPLYAMWPAAPNVMAYAWIGAINAGLLALAIRALVPVIGPCWRLLLLFPLLAPLWQAGALWFLPDLPAGMLLTIAMALAWQIGMAMLTGEPPGWRKLLAFEACLIAALYLRGPMLVASLGLHAILLAVALGMAGQRWRLSGPILAGLIAFGAALSPWSITVSRHFDYPIVTTTNFALVIADGFGDPDRLCGGPCGAGADIVPAWEYSLQQAARQGRHPFDLQRTMMAASLEGLTVRGYLAEVRRHFGAFLFAPDERLRIRLGLSFAVPREHRATFLHAALIATLVLYIPFLAALLAANVVPVVRNDALALQSILIKGMTACLFLQPFLHKSSGRYWIALCAMAAWSAALLWRAWQGWAAPVAKDRALPRWLDAMQVFYGIGFAATGAAILLA